MEFYQTAKLDENLYVIVDIVSRDVFPVQNYVIVGTERAAIIDTGLGIGDIRAVVRTLTDLPIIALHTHAHLDHTGGDQLFDDNYLNPIERVPSGQETTAQHAAKGHLLAGFAGGNAELAQHAAEHLLPSAQITYLPVRDGDTFDLGGGTVLEAVAIPGHTIGSLAYVDRAGRFAFTGDGIADIHWFDGDSAFNTVDGFLRTLDHFTENAHGAERIYAAHLPEPFDLAFISKLQTSARNIINGSDDPVENADYLFLKHGELRVNRVDDVRIYYKPENILASA
ncbi:MAG: MBL fold metallo-hydrolase [Oscillospiraceae bacterium]|jgi:glyoxylase-like metal-dependent hydrolase (beta-lactamase superfamily II)|nr:MBL fold metallo-hydrolase [Oscillospiraceae bacterium]